MFVVQAGEVFMLCTCFAGECLAEWLSTFSPTWESRFQSQRRGALIRILTVCAGVVMMSNVV